MKHVFIVAIVFLVLASCSTRKDRAVNRAYHQTTTKFNVLFNGEEAIAAGIEAEIASHQHNFWEQLPVEPFSLVDLFTLSPKENANFSRGEEKAVIAVQKHSIVSHEELLFSLRTAAPSEPVVPSCITVI